MTKELLMTPKAVYDRKRYQRIAAKNRAEGKIATAPVGRTLLNTQKAVYDRAAYRRKKAKLQLRERMISTNVVDVAPAKSELLEALTVPVSITVSDANLDKLTRKELKKLVLESRRGVNASIPIPLKCREEWDPNVTKILQTDLAKFIAQKQDLEGANAQIEALKAQQSTDLAIIHERNVSLEQLNSQLTAANEDIREKDSTIAQLRSEIQIARRQRDDANTHSGIVTKNLEMANELIKANNERGVEIDRKIDDLNIGMGELNRRAIRWKSAFFATLFVVALPAVATAGVAVYILAHR